MFSLLGKLINAVNSTCLLVESWSGFTQLTVGWIWQNDYKIIAHQEGRFYCMLPSSK